jgi:hypothetical protein
VPTLRQGSSPGESCSLREFWGRRYNACISEHCRASIFAPLLRAGWGPAAASLAVFAYTGALHAVPSRLGGISWPQAGAPPGTKRTRLVPTPVLIRHAAST